MLAVAIFCTETNFSGGYVLSYVKRGNSNDITGLREVLFYCWLSIKCRPIQCNIAYNAICYTSGWFFFIGSVGHKLSIDVLHAFWYGNVQTLCNIFIYIKYAKDTF